MIIKKIAKISTRILFFILIIFTNNLFSQNHEFKKNTIIKNHSYFYIDSFNYNKEKEIKKQIKHYLNNYKKYYYFLNYNNIDYQLTNLESNNNSYYLKFKNKNDFFYITNDIIEYNKYKKHCTIYYEGIFFREGVLSFGENKNKFIIKQKLKNSYLTSNLKLHFYNNKYIAKLHNSINESTILEFILKENKIEVFKKPFSFEGEFNHNFINCDF